MAYCAPADVASEFRNLDITSTGAIITSAKLTEWISQTGAVIDARLTSKYVTPITGAGALEIIKNICIWIVAERVSKIMDLKANPPMQGEGIKVIRVGAGTAKDAMSMLDDIMGNRMVLADAILRNNSAGIMSRNVSHNQEHQFKRNVVQW